MKTGQLRLYILAFAAITAAGAKAQIEVRDSLTQEPVPYVSVYYGNHTGGYTDEAGTIAIPDGAEQARLSHICYETKSVSLAATDRAASAPAQPHAVWLVPKSQSIAEVSVSAKAPKQVKTERVGTVLGKTQTQHRGANGFEMALFIPYDSAWTEAPYIHSILASLDYSTHWLTFTTIKTPIHATLRFDLRVPDTATGTPRDTSLIDGGILLPPTQKPDKEGIRLPRPIPFPQAGVFVVIEWITTASVDESQSLVPSLNMTFDTTTDRTWNKKSFRGMDWMREQDEPVYQGNLAQSAYKGRIPCAKLGLAVSK